MTHTFDLTKLGPHEFSNMVNFLALLTLGSGNTGFGPGADGGRDGYFEGEAPYPSDSDRWKGVWYIQSKFHSPHLSADPQKWLIRQVASEISDFDSDESDRVWPDNWIIATNIEPSGKPTTGSFDAIRKKVKKSKAGKKIHVDIWGGRKILDLLALHPDVSKYYRHFLTPGHLIAGLIDDLGDRTTSITEIIRYFVVNQFADNLFTKLDQAGSSSDVRPGVHDLFIDIPFGDSETRKGTLILSEFCRAAAQCHKYSLRKLHPSNWQAWTRQSPRARVALLKGGPGQGKSTVGQYLSQIHRARLLLSEDAPPIADGLNQAAQAVQNAAISAGFWPEAPRIPIQVELKDYAHWYSQQSTDSARSVLTYLAHVVNRKTGVEVLPKTMKRALSFRTWIVVFDGLDEVPNDFKDRVAEEVLTFLNDLIVEVDADVFSICTSRPQGYSGQFAALEGPVLELTRLDERAALLCASPVLSFGRSTEEATKSLEILQAAVRSPNVRELMTTPLQAHIMAVVVRDGGRPPERRWQLFNSFYHVMKKRESLKDFKDPRIARLLREEDRLLKSVHAYLGFVLHARAERSEGAQTHLSKAEFKQLVTDAVMQQVQQDVEDTVAGVMEATTERLVLVSTPESGEHVRFDIRQLQEFFAAEFLYAGVDSTELASRIAVVGGDAHWREVMHFLLSALIENQRPTDLAIAVQTLRRANEGDEGAKDRIYHRRMARASFLIIRLLTEGVLEQDHRDRQQIRPLLDPIGGILDIDSLNLLRTLKGPRSRQWLLEWLIEKVNCNLPIEAVGILHLLGWLLPDGSESSHAAKFAFQNLPSSLQETLIRHWFPPHELEYFPKEFYGDDPPLSQWVVDLAVAHLCTDRWMSSSPDILRGLMGICRRASGKKLTEACMMSGFDSKFADALGSLLTLYEIPRATKNEAGREVDCGVVVGRLYKANLWGGELRPLRNIPAFDLSRNATGWFSLLFTSAYCAQHHEGSGATNFKKLAKLPAFQNVMCVLPSTLLALLPICGPHSKTPYLVDESFDWWKYPPPPDGDNSDSSLGLFFSDLFISKTKDSDEERWARLARRLPRIAVNWAFSGDMTPWKTAVHFGPELIRLVEESPNWAMQNILSWGHVQKQLPKLIDVLKLMCRGRDTYESDQSRIFIHGEVEPFALALPQDLPVLNVLAPALIELLTNPERQRFVRRDFEMSRRSLFASYSLTESVLREVAESTEHDRPIRVAALSLCWICWRDSSLNGPKLDLRREYELYSDLVGDANRGWFTRAFIFGLLMGCSESDATALWVATKLTELCLECDCRRDQVATLLCAWREKSSAPVHAKQAIERWLGYNFKPPDYVR